MRLNKGPAGAHSAGTVSDLETRLNDGDHKALRLWLRLLACSNRIEAEINRRLRTDFSTTLARFDLMAQLQRSPDGLKMNELSRRLMVTGGNVTGLTDQLERDGLVERSEDLADRRAYSVRLTALGQERFDAMALVHETWVVELLGGLGASEKLTVYNLLGKLKSHLNSASR